MLKKIHFSDRKIIQVLIIFSSVVVILMSLIGDKGWLQLNKLKNLETNLSQEIETLKLEEIHWNQKIRSLKKNQTYMETIAREKLGMIKKNEELLLFTQDVTAD